MAAPTLDDVLQILGRAAGQNFHEEEAEPSASELGPVQVPHVVNSVDCGTQAFSYDSTNQCMWKCLWHLRRLSICCTRHENRTCAAMECQSSLKPDETVGQLKFELTGKINTTQEEACRLQDFLQLGWDYMHKGPLKKLAILFFVLDAGGGVISVQLLVGPECGVYHPNCKIDALVVRPCGSTFSHYTVIPLAMGYDSLTVALQDIPGLNLQLLYDETTHALPAQSTNTTAGQQCSAVAVPRRVRPRSRINPMTEYLCVRCEQQSAELACVPCGCLCVCADCATGLANCPVRGCGEHCAFMMKVNLAGIPR